MKKVGIGILGLGTVGGGAYRILTQNHESIMRKENLDLQVVKVLEKSPQIAIQKGVPKRQNRRQHRRYNFQSRDRHCSGGYRRDKSPQNLLLKGVLSQANMWSPQTKEPDFKTLALN